MTTDNEETYGVYNPSTNTYKDDLLRMDYNRVYDGLLSLDLLKEYFTMTAVNAHKYQGGYHSNQHILRALNTLFWAVEHTPDTELESFLAEAIALIWHDCCYATPNDDSCNTARAIGAFRRYSTRDCTDLDKATVVAIIAGMMYPYNEAQVSTSIELARDCDHSMILYNDHHVTLFPALLAVEHQVNFTDWKQVKAVRDATAKYLAEVSFNYERFQKIWKAHHVDVKYTLDMYILEKFFWEVGDGNE